MRTLAEVDKDIAATEQVIKQLEADKQKNTDLLVEAKSTREKHALNALTGGDAKAQNHLSKARAATREVEQLLEDIAAATAQANGQLAQLRSEREEAQRAAAWQEFLTLNIKAQETAHFLDGAVSALGELLQQHHAELRQLTALSATAGRPRVFGLKHFWRCLNGRLHKILPYEFPRQADIYSVGGYEKFLADQINGTGNAATPEAVDETAQAS